ncbi:hypothetical protein ACTA71_000631 [Dictyostelium dimigraforme]
MSKQEILKLNKPKPPPKEIIGEETIEECCKCLGELYKYFDGNDIYNPSETELRNGYKYIYDKIKPVIDDPKFTEQVKDVFQITLDWVTLAFNILNDQHFRSIYNEKFLKKYIELEQQEEYNKFINKIKSGLYFILSLPIKLITYQFSKPNNKLTTLEIIKSIYNSGGIGGFLHGTYFQLISFVMLDATDSISNKVFGICSTTKSNETKGIFSTFYIWFLYFIKIKSNFIVDIIYSAPLSMSTSEIIKKIIFRYDNVGGEGFKISNLYYSLFWFMFIYASYHFIDQNIKIMEKKVILKSKENPNSFLFKYTSLILTNPIGGSLFRTLLQWPLLMIKYQYSNDIVQSFLTNSPIPISTNPILMAIRMYNRNGFKKFYDGVFSCGLPFYYFLNNYSNLLNK